MIYLTCSGRSVTWGAARNSVVIRIKSALFFVTDLYILKTCRLTLKPLSVEKTLDVTRDHCVTSDNCGLCHMKDRRSTDKIFCSYTLNKRLPKVATSRRGLSACVWFYFTKA